MADRATGVCVVAESMDEGRRLCGELEAVDASITAQPVRSGKALLQAVEDGVCDVVAAIPGVKRFDAHKALAALEEASLSRPVVGIRRDDDEISVVDALEAGLADLVDIAEPRHLALVIRRETARNRAPAAEKDFTGVYSRLHFLKLLQQRLAEEPGDRFRGLLYFQLDNFSWINENFGIDGGDEYLVSVAGRIRDLLGRDNLPARYHGGTFIALIEEDGIPELQEKALALCERIGDHVHEFRHQQVSSTISAGLCLVENIEGGVEALVARAFEACESAKASGGNCVEWYAEAGLDGGGEGDPAAWIHRIRRAFENDMFSLMYQPVVSLQGSRKPRYELFLRMHNDSGETVMPGVFLPIAERAGLMTDIDRWVITQAIDSARRMLRDRVEPRLFVKLSGKSLIDKTMPSWISQAFSQQQCPGDVIVFEITESLARTHLVQARAMTSMLRKLGCGIGLDHFGTGKRSLLLLDQLEVDYLKIDGTLVRALNDHEVQQKVRKITEKARSRNVRCIAESIQSAAALPIVWQFGIEFVQGYFLQEPQEDMHFDFNQLSF